MHVGVVLMLLHSAPREGKRLTPISFVCVVGCGVSAAGVKGMSENTGNIMDIKKWEQWFFGSLVLKSGCWHSRGDSKSRRKKGIIGWISVSLQDLSKEVDGGSRSLVVLLA